MEDRLEPAAKRPKVMVVGYRAKAWCDASSAEQIVSDRRAPHPVKSRVKTG